VVNIFIEGRYVGFDDVTYPHVAEPQYISRTYALEGIIDRTLHEPLVFLRTPRRQFNARQEMRGKCSVYNSLDHSHNRHWAHAVADLPRSDRDAGCPMVVDCESRWDERSEPIWIAGSRFQPRLRWDQIPPRVEFGADGSGEVQGVNEVGRCWLQSVLPIDSPTDGCQA